MKGLYFDNSLRLRKDLLIPSPGKGESLIKVSVAGICATDLEILKGYMNFRGIIGHEFVGQVVHSGNGSLIGKRVVGEINCFCGSCRMCRKGLKNHCLKRTVLGIHGRDGAMAQYTVLPDRNLYIVPEGTVDEVAVFTEPLAACFEVLSQVNFPTDSDVLIMGDGRLGQLMARVMKNTGVHLRVYGKSERKLSLMKKVGITGTLTRPEGSFDYVIECTGKPEGILEAIEMVRPRGTIILKTTIHTSPPTPLSQLVVDEITLIGSRCGPFPDALSALAGGAIQVSDLITGMFPLDEWKRAFEETNRKETLKILLRID
jgi:threonine dehydrogenase-like Zn-dependent dehydrogenase